MERNDPICERCPGLNARDVEWDPYERLLLCGGCREDAHKERDRADREEFLRQRGQG